MRKRKPNRIRKWFIGFAVLVSVFLMMGTLPIFKMQTSGIENYQREYCHVGLTSHLYPSEDFLNRYEYMNGDYHYYCNGVLGDMYRVAFSVLEYAPEQCETAKEYCFQQFTNTDAHRYQIGDYHFIEHLWTTSQIDSGEWVVTCSYPEMFNMFAYNDANHSLLFMGYYEPDCDPDTQLARTDFEGFYEKHFAKYYDLE